MGSTFLVFVMLYITVDISLVLGYSGEYRVKVNGPAGEDGKPTRVWAVCAWTTENDNKDFKVTCDKGTTLSCVYSTADPTTCAWYVQNTEEYFKKLAGKSKGIHMIITNWCKSTHDLIVGRCGSVKYHTAGSQISEDLLWEDE